MLKNQKGFTLIETLLLILVISFIAFASWYVWDSNKKSVTESGVTTKVEKTTTTSNYSLSEKYIDPKDKTEFSYPKSWKLNIEKQDEISPGFASGTLTSPSGKVELDYSNYVTGVGGGTCPEAFPCPTIYVLKNEDVPNFKNLKLIEKITYWKGNGDGYMPAFGLSNADTASEWKVGSKQSNDFYLFANFSEDGGKFAYSYSPNSRADSGFKTYKEAVNFLNSAEVKTAQQILLSTKSN